MGTFTFSLLALVTLDVVVPLWVFIWLLGPTTKDGKTSRAASDTQYGFTGPGRKAWDAQESKLTGAEFYGMRRVSACILLFLPWPSA